MHEKNAFITLTYDDEHLVSHKLIYEDFQKFMKKLRKVQNAPIGVFVTGEYGETTKRPHWHAILFNWSPPDGVYQYTNDNGDRVFTSAQLTKIWGKGNCNYGAVTFKSAGYCARYAAKKLVHGKDQDHDFQPISKKSSKHAIGKRWLEEHWSDIFSYGRLVLPDGSETGIPRYYEKWFKEHHPDHWIHYLTNVKIPLMERAQSRADETQSDWKIENHKRLDEGKLTFTKTENERRAIITEQKFKQLQAYLKL